MNWLRGGGSELAERSAHEHPEENLCALNHV